MTLRVLPPEEWDKLVGTELEAAFEYFNPANTRVLVVEDQGRIVGTWAMLRTVHAEGIWINPGYRGAFGVAKRLLRGMRNVAREWDVPVIFTGSISPHVTHLIERLGGAPFPGESFVIPTSGNQHAV